MKFQFPLLFGLSMLLALTACEKDSCEQTWSQMTSVPVTLNRQQVQDSIEAQAPREFCTGGNIYAYGQYIFVNVDRQGYHVLDNSNPANPTPVSFLQVPGATNLAFVDGKMISDSYADLLVLDFQGPNEINLLSSTPNFLLTTEGFEIDPGAVAVGFEQQLVEFTQSCDGNIFGNWGGCVNCAFDVAVLENTGGIRSGGTPRVNVSGSLSRLAFCDQTVYVLGTDRLTSYALTGVELVQRNNTSLPWGQETLIRRGEWLYVASTTAMRIFDIDGCGDPREVGTAPHTWARDPVAVEGNRAVITTRWGNATPGRNNGQMIVYDITDRTNPIELARHEMAFPIGVALDEGVLYICDGVDGLRVFDFNGSENTILSRELDRFDRFPAVDVAVLPYASGTTVLTIGDEHLTQYARSADGQHTELVQVEVDRCNAL